MKKIGTVIAFSFILIFILVGCSVNNTSIERDIIVVERKIVDKREIYQTPAMIMQFNGKTFFPMFIPRPTLYEFDLEIDNSGDISQKTISVNLDDYSQFEIGDYYEEVYYGTK